MIKDSMQFSWKTFPVDLPSIEQWLRSNAPSSYVGNSADENQLVLWFNEIVSQDDKLAIEQHWNSLTEVSEAASIAHREAQDRAVKYATDNLAYKPLAQWVPAEIKIFIKQPLSSQDREDLLVLYPNT